MHVAHSWRHVAVALLALGAARGCGQSDPRGTETATSVDSGLPPERPARELTDADARVLCDAVADVVSRSLTDEDFCTLRAVIETFVIDSESTSTEFDGAMCHARLETCLSSGLTFKTRDCTTATASSLSDCDATVQELELCWSAQLRAFDALSCSRTPTREDLAGLDPELTLPECQSLTEGCPPSFGETRGDEGMGSPGALPASLTGCDDTCFDAGDRFCDDGGPGSDTDFCGFGTDCTDCGPREPAM